MCYLLFVTLCLSDNLVSLGLNDVQVFVFFFCLFKVTPAAYGGSQAGGLSGAAAAGLHHSHSSKGSEPRLQPTPQLKAKLDP